MLEEQLKAKMPIRNNKITTSNSGGIEKACWGHWKGPYWFVFFGEQVMPKRTSRRAGVPIRSSKGY
jgi:hypothetical protein